MRKILLTLSICLAFITSINAQFQCGTDLEYNKAKGRNPFLAEAERNYEQLIQDQLLQLSSNRDGELEAILYIPVVFHIVHQEGDENISDEQIFDQMFVLNRDYRLMNPDTIEIIDGYDTLKADIRLQFQLATKDFEGNCTNGIERISSIETYIGDNGSKLNQWPRDRYLNIWTVLSMENGTAGYSQYPSSVLDDLSAKADGVIIRHNYIGRIGTAGEFYSRALTHEVGHYLNLAHLWGSTNEPEVNCGDDGVLDTPETKGHLSCDLYDHECNGETLAAVYTFDDVTTTSGTIDPTDPPTTIGDVVTFGPVQAVGVSDDSTVEDKFGFSDWALGSDGINDTLYSSLTGTIDLTKYYEFTINAPDTGHSMTLTSLSFDVKRSVTGPRTYVVRSSVTGNFGSNLPASIFPSNPNLAVVSSGTNIFFIKQDTTTVTTQLGSKITLGAAYAKTIQPVTFRIYAWNAEDSTGVFEIDNLTINGTYGLIENVQNYMEYSYCSHMFTKGQKDRMRATLALGVASRNTLVSDNNHYLTGINGYEHTPCAPIADFYPRAHFVCLDNNIQFINNSTNGEITSYLWNFPDGTPSTSTEENPTVSFSTTGWKDVTLTVGNATGSDTRTIVKSVLVTADYTEYPSGFPYEGFDSYDEFYNHWVPGNRDHNTSTWYQTDLAGYSNSTSAVLNAYDMDVQFIDEGGNDIDDLISPAMDLSNYSSTECTFKWSYATQSTLSTGITDYVLVTLSNDCGENWSAPIKTNQTPSGAPPYISIPSSKIVTAGNVATPFVPSVAEDWKEASFNIPDVYTVEGFRMRFTFYAGLFPNNFFLDDINITGNVGVDEEHADFYGASLMPNPSERSTLLSYYNNSSANLNIVLTDMSGRIVEQWTPGNTTTGKQTLEINTSELAKGVYMVHLKSNGNTSTLKLMVR